LVTQGDTLFYQSGDQIMSVSYAAKGEAFVTDKPRLWVTGMGGTEWDLAPDGRCIAVLRPVEAVEPARPERVLVFV
jgi:hypothetical protein